MRAPAAHGTLLVAAALCCMAGAAVTVAWCASMASMPGMDMPGDWTMSMAWMRMPGQGWPGAATTFLGMWTAMMVAMMLPALVPMLARYQESLGAVPVARRHRLTLRVAAGYFGAWLLLGLAIYTAGAVCAGVAMRDAAVSRLAPTAGALALLVAGALQSGHRKRRALAACRDCRPCCPAVPAAAWRHGFALGARCLRCCAPWTAALLVMGVMDLAAMTLVTAAICLERLLPGGERIARITGGVLLCAGAFALATRGAAGA